MIKKSLDKERIMDLKEAAPKQKNKFSLTLDYRFVIGLLLVIIVVMLAFWRPWEFRPAENARTVSATGTATLTAVPDEFVFTPSYEFEGEDKDAVLKELTAKSGEVVKKLKELGVADSKIKTNADGYDFPIYGYEGEGDGAVTQIAPVPPRDTQPTYTLRLTVTVNDKTLAQKVQDYLLTTSPTGAVSPQVTFSESKRKELESKARDTATKEARAKAEQSAKNLGFSVGPVKSVNDGTGFGDVYPALMEGSARDTGAPSSKLSLQPGENDLTYSVTVVYYIK